MKAEKRTEPSVDLCTLCARRHDALTMKDGKKTIAVNCGDARHLDCPGFKPDHSLYR